MNEILMVELTEEELEMVMESRAKAEKKRRLEAYIAEINDIIDRARKDGFVIAANHPFKSCERIGYATTWGDSQGNYIAIR